MNARLAAALVLCALTFCAGLTSCEGVGEPAYDNIHDPAGAEYTPTPPGGLSVTPSSDSRIAVWWQDRSLGETGFTVERRRSTDSDFLVVGTVAPDSHRYTDTIPITTGIQYRYRVQALGRHAGISTEAVMQLNFHPPEYFRFRTPSADSVEIQWRDRSSFETGIEVTRSMDGGEASPPDTLPPNSTRYADGGLIARSRYEYRVVPFTPYNATAAHIPVVLRFVPDSIVSTERFEYSGNGMTAIGVSEDASTFAVGHTLYSTPERDYRVHTLGPGGLRSRAGHTGWIRSVAVHAGRRIVASAGSDGLILIWNTDDDSLHGSIGRPPGTDGTVDVVGFSEDGTQLVAGGSDGSLAVYSTGDWSLVRLIPNPAACTYAKITGDGQSVAAGFADQSFRIYRIVDGAAALTGSSLGGSMFSASWNAETVMVAGSGSVRSYRAAGWTLIGEIRSAFRGMTCTGDGRFIVLTGTAHLRSTMFECSDGSKVVDFSYTGNGFGEEYSLVAIDSRGVRFGSIDDPQHLVIRDLAHRWSPIAGATGR